MAFMLDITPGYRLHFKAIILALGTTIYIIILFFAFYLFIRDSIIGIPYILFSSDYTTPSLQAITAKHHDEVSRRSITTIPLL